MCKYLNNLNCILTGILNVLTSLFFFVCGQVLGVTPFFASVLLEQSKPLRMNGRSCELN